MIVALYARVSTTKQAEKDLSIPDQLRQMREWCKARHYGIAMEYVEPGASATDDRRPVFQQMIGDACISPPPFDAIIVHSLSRFYRDAIEFGLRERQLKKHGVLIISITQETSNDSSGEMARRMISMFDEYSSKENGKHTLRAMNENARRGFFNGSTPPYGFMTVDAKEIGNNGKKKRLIIDNSEAAIVRKIYDLYLNGYKGKSFGLLSIANHLNDMSLTNRGKDWKLTIIHNILSHHLYLGECTFNRMETKTRKIKPESEWIKISVEPIIDKETFDLVQKRMSERSPKNVPPRIVNCPTLLTGLLKCGACGAPMTLATGKGGSYRYYKCTTRIHNGKDACKTQNIRMEKLDSLILDALAEKVFTPPRVTAMLKTMGNDLKSGKEDQESKLKKLSKELYDQEQKTDRLFDAVEKGLLPSDSTLYDRVHKNQARRQEIITEIASLKREKEFPLSKLSPKNVHAFCSVLSEKLKDKESNFGKEYIKLLVDEISVEGENVHLKGGYGALAGAIQKTKLGHSAGVPSFGNVWLPSADSNHGPDG
jgi:site-specific DNA recombinase